MTLFGQAGVRQPARQPPIALANRVGKAKIPHGCSADKICGLSMDFCRQIQAGHLSKVEVNVE